jgi:hypothetical protein
LGIVLLVKTTAVMAGLVPAIHVYAVESSKDVDARHMPGMTSRLKSRYAL